MRLIDADKIIKETWGVVIKDMFHMDETVEVISRKDIDNAPTVKAIPVEWIENKLNCCDNINAEIFVKALIRDWEEENDFATNSRLGNRSNGDNDSNISSTTNSGVYKESITR